ncbi:glycoside hydrolase family 99-like domain-containing protein [Gammaproteobacteria bacterium]|nr:glycoside hydrolase family 99-like domain-containing protein [Gammaproteobacteria bacterium]
MIIEALYLPQFHRFDENDKWWGEGFTEWSNLKNAQSQFKGHSIIKTPIWGEYDLSNPENMARQFEYAKHIGVDVFSVYHYWSNGKLLMQRPIENLLERPNLDFKFYFNWGNHSFFNKIHFSNKKLLWKQEYSDLFINSHVRYLHRAMEDRRYHRIGDKPVLNIYDPRNIPNFSDYLSMYKELFLKKFGTELHLRVTLKDYKDIVLINKNRELIDSVYEYQPYLANHSTPFRHYFYELKLRFGRDLLKTISIFDANEIVKKIVHGKKNFNDMPYGFGAYTGWDTTPRWGAKGIVHKNFENEMLNLQISAAQKKAQQDDFIVITAWNEWGEGAIMEPCKERQSFNLL